MTKGTSRIRRRPAKGGGATRPAKPRARRAGRKPRRRAAGGGGRRWQRGLLLLLFPLLVVTAFYLLYLDHAVRELFDGKKWSVPARVYARPLELYVGANLTADQLSGELGRLRYQEQRGVAAPGTWERNGPSFRLRTRAFRFWDGDAPGRLVELRFDGARISSLKEGNGHNLPLARLEPQEIGRLHTAHDEDRILVSHGELPGLLVDTLITVEDRAFFDHFGLNPKGIARALWVNLQAGGVVQGGSTLTQQLVKNLWLSAERSLWRKANEALMAPLLELHYSKQEILEAYANEIYLGQDGARAIHGFGLASRFYFNRSLSELDLPQVALLVGIIKGPSFYDPRRHPERARQRRDLVLDLLQQQGVIDPKRAAEARREPLGVSAEKGSGEGDYPAFMDLVRRHLRTDYREEDLTSEGLRIFTTLDTATQQQAERAVQARLAKLEQGRAKGPLEAAAVIADPASGEVLALVGGRDARFDGFNRALDAVRPIGSLVKPVVYLSALMQPQHYTLVSRLRDQSVQIPGPDGGAWSPQNYDHKEHGEVPLHEALTHSYNLATVRLGLDLGLDRVIETLHALGVEREVAPYPSLLLGALSLSPLEVTQLYQTFAADGFHTPLRAILGVQAADGAAIQRYHLAVRQRIDAGPVYLLGLNLQRVVTDGTARSLGNWLPLDLHIAGKTGTTDDLRDSWFAGFSGDKVAVVWVGRDDNGPTGLSGASGALQVWGEMIKGVHPRPLDLIRPEGVETVWIDPRSGLRADAGCDGAVMESFIVGSAPAIQSSCMKGPEPEARGGGWDLWRSLFE